MDYVNEWTIFEPQKIEPRGTVIRGIRMQVSTKRVPKEITMKAKQGLKQ